MQEFYDAIRAAGLTPPDPIPTGRIIAFPGLDKRKGNTAARCFLFPDRRGGWFMDYSTGLFEAWQAQRDQPYTAAERQAFRAQCERDRKAREAEQDQAHRAAADKARRIWMYAPPATADNGYCRRKGVPPHGARQTRDGALIVPMYDDNLELINLQFIQTDGTKRFLKGGQKQGRFWWIGQRTDTVLIAEGFATAASVYEYTGLQTFIAFDAGNLVNVAEIIKAKRADAEIIITGDNDENGVGQEAARAAALAVGGKYLLPPEPGTDFNDYLASTEAQP